MIFIAALAWRPRVIFPPSRTDDCIEYSNEIGELARRRRRRRYRRCCEIARSIRRRANSTTTIKFANGKSRGSFLSIISVTYALFTQTFCSTQLYCVRTTLFAPTKPPRACSAYIHSTHRFAPRALFETHDRTEVEIRLPRRGLCTANNWKRRQSSRFA